MGKFIITEEEKRHIKSLYEQETSGQTQNVSTTIDKTYFDKNPKGVLTTNNRKIVSVTSPNNTELTYKGDVTIADYGMDSNPCLNGNKKWSYEKRPNEGSVRLTDITDKNCKKNGYDYTAFGRL